jgi:hypothetical protein
VFAWFARNERVVCVFESPEHGPFVLEKCRRDHRRQYTTVWQWRGQPGSATILWPSGTMRTRISLKRRMKWAVSFSLGFDHR